MRKKLRPLVPVELGTEKIGKLLLDYALPAIIAQTAASLYNVVDAVFIGHGVGAYAISGLAVTFPFMNVAAAFGTLVGVGASTLASILLGEKRYDAARRTLGNVVILNTIIGVAFASLCFIFLDPILHLFGAGENTIGYAREYMEIILAGNVVTHLYFGLNSMLRASGHPREAMYAIIITVVLNAILDPIFIFGLNTGIRGVAVATIISQIAALIWIVKLLSNPLETVHFEKKVFRLDPKIVKRSLSIGLSPFLMNLAACLVVILVNNSFKEYGGELAIGAYGIVNRVTFIFVMVVLGLTQGMQPIAGYNFGARNTDRVIEVLRITLLYATGILTVGCLTAWFLPEQVCRCFTTDSELVSQSATGLTYMMSVFPFAAVSMVTGIFFQSIGKPVHSILISLSRQLLILIPLIFTLPKEFGIEGIWMSFPISDILAAIISTVLLFKFLSGFRTFQHNSADSRRK